MPDRRVDDLASDGAGAKVEGGSDGVAEWYATGTGLSYVALVNLFDSAPRHSRHIGATA